MWQTELYTTHGFSHCRGAIESNGLDTGPRVVTPRGECRLPLLKDCAEWRLGAVKESHGGWCPEDLFNALDKQRQQSEGRFLRTHLLPRWGFQVRLFLPGDYQWRVGAPRYSAHTGGRPQRSRLYSGDGPRFHLSCEASKFTSPQRQRWAVVVLGLCDGEWRAVLASGSDWLQHFAEFARYVCFAVDMHGHRAWEHDVHHDDRKVSVGDNFSLSMGPHSLRESVAAEGKHEHDMTTLDHLQLEGEVVLASGFVR